MQLYLILYPYTHIWASLVAQLAKNLPAVQETPVQFLGQEDSPGEGISYPLQYSGLENFMDYIVYGVALSRTQLSNFHFLISDVRQMLQPPNCMNQRLPPLVILIESMGKMFLCLFVRWGGAGLTECQQLPKAVLWTLLQWFGWLFNHLLRKLNLAPAHHLGIWYLVFWCH